MKCHECGGDSEHCDCETENIGLIVELDGYFVVTDNGVERLKVIKNWNEDK